MRSIARRIYAARLMALVLGIVLALATWAVVDWEARL
jgi:hypothetical protein